MGCFDYSFGDVFDVGGKPDDDNEHTCDVESGCFRGLQCFSNVFRYVPNEMILLRISRCRFLYYWLDTFTTN